MQDRDLEKFGENKFTQEQVELDSVADDNAGLDKVNQSNLNNNDIIVNKSLGQDQLNKEDLSNNGEHEDTGQGQVDWEKELEGQKLTPLMQQYFKIRVKYPDVLLMFQVGDFYELFFEDAKRASAVLSIALTKRGTFNGKPIPLCGVPVHTLEHHLGKLVKAGLKVAVCNQLEEAVPGKVVERGVSQVFTPGTIIDSKLLDEKSASYLFSFFPTENSLGLLFGELLTAQLFATVIPVSGEKLLESGTALGIKLLESEIVRFFPDEILLPDSKAGKSFQSFFKSLGYFTTLENLDLENTESVKNLDYWVNGQFDKKVVDNLNNNKSILYALYNFYNYVNKNQVGAIEHFKALNFYEPEDFMILDPSTQKNLELVKNLQDGSRKNSLFEVMDMAVTSMGSRMIRKWISRPLVKKEAIEQRFDAVGSLLYDVTLAQRVKELLLQMGDVERIVGRIALRRATIGDYLGLYETLEVIPSLKTSLKESQGFRSSALLKAIESGLCEFGKIKDLLKSAINTDQSKEWVIKSGFDSRLDHLRELVFDSNNKILELEEKEKKETGISSLKIGYNRVTGYYIEVTKTNLHLVPNYYKRESTLSNRERFTCAQLRDMQDDIVKAKSQIVQVENEIFENIKEQIYGHISELRKLANALANLDALLSFASIAYNRGYTRPNFDKAQGGSQTGLSVGAFSKISGNKDDILGGNSFSGAKNSRESGQINIIGGRHPVVEASGNIDFISNDLVLNSQQSLLIITGPNMGGKSTFLRQAALICIMAQCGSFVPAKSANLCLLDRIFTRIGSGDNLAGGKSTFLVEMEETALICRFATKNSFVILDEVGRGTSTYDGFAIAKAVVEHIHTRVGAKCLFATHYHELSNMQESFPAIASYYAASKKHKDGITFLYKIVKGVADGSFGIEVAKLANLPAALISRANIILDQLHDASSGLAIAHKDRLPSGLKNLSGQVQHSIFDSNPKIVGNENFVPAGKITKDSANASLACQECNKSGARENTLLEANYALEQKIRELSLRERDTANILENLKGLDFEELSPKKAFDILWELRKNIFS